MASLNDRLRAVPFFRALPARELTAIANRLQRRAIRKGALLFREGDRADAMFLIESGELEVMHGLGDHPVAVLGAGSFAGELGLLLGEPRSATLRASAPTRVWVLKRDDLDLLLSDHPAIARELTAELGRRLVSTTRRLGVGVDTRFTAVINADVQPLVEAIAHLGDRVAVLPLRRQVLAGNAHVLDGGLLRGDGLVPAARAALRDVDHVVVALPRRLDPRTRMAVDLAEWVVTNEELTPWVLKRKAPDRQLIVPEPADWTAVARRVTGRAVGLAFSSGGSKTIAHIGVYAALREMGISVDAVAGSSGGALVGVGVAAPRDPAVLEQYIAELAGLLRPRKWDFHTVPRTGLIKGKRLRDLLDRWFDGAEFKDLAIPLYIVASDVNTGEEIVLSSGSLAEAVRASMSIPGVFDPWRLRGRVFIDGGVTDPLPAGRLRDAGYERVIASNVAGKDTDPAAAAGKKLPSIITVMTRTVNLMEAEVIKAHLPLADVVIRPVVAASGSFDFGRVAEFVEAGRQATYQRADELAALTGVAVSRP